MRVFLFCLPSEILFAVRLIHSSNGLLHCFDVCLTWYVWHIKVSVMVIPTPTLWTRPCYATITDLLGVLAVPVLPKNMMTIYQQFPQIWYVSQVSVILVRWSVNSLSRMRSFALFSIIAKLTDGSQSLSTKSLISPPVQNQYVIQGMGGRRLVAEDVSLSKSR